MDREGNGAQELLQRRGGAFDLRSSGSWGFSLGSVRGLGLRVLEWIYGFLSFRGLGFLVDLRFFFVFQRFRVLGGFTVSWSCRGRKI